MKAVDAGAEILKREGVKYVFAYPNNPIIDAVARGDLHPIIVRQERVGLHMADAYSRVNSGDPVGVFVMQHGPGAENAFGGVAQAYGDSVPLVIIPDGYPRAINNIPPNFNSFVNYRTITKWCEQVTLAECIPDALRRAFTQARNGRPRPALVEIPRDVFDEEVSEPLNYKPSIRTRIAPDPKGVEEVAEVLARAKRPVIYAGQGVHYARAWDELQRLAELLAAPVTTSLQGKSAFPENHPLSLGTAGRAFPPAVRKFLDEADVIFGIGCSFSRTNYGVTMPTDKVIVQATVDPADLAKDVPIDHGLVGDAGLVLEALIPEVKERLGKSKRNGTVVAKEIEASRQAWLKRWEPKLTSGDTPLNPYRVIWDLLHTVDLAETIITHDAGSPRDQLSPFWRPVAPLSYLGWGKTTQLGYGLGLAMGAKVARPEKLCINVWGDAAIGMTGMDFETAVREGIPILSILLNNFSMAIELKVMRTATEKFRSTDISGNYAAMAQAFGGFGERVERPEEIVPAIKRGIAKTREGVPALLEFVTSQEVEISTGG